MRDHYDRGPARRDSGRPSYRDRDSRGSDDRSEREMFDAVCDNCGRNCKVPFRPSGNKPVYCSDCFEKMQNAERGGYEERPRRDFGRDREEMPSRERYISSDSVDVKTQLASINSKLYQILKILEGPSKPVFNKMEPVKRKPKTEVKVEDTIIAEEPKTEETSEEVQA